MKFCVIKNTITQQYLGHEIVEGRKYSTYTDEGAYFGQIFAPLDELLNHSHWYRLTIFESLDKAEQYVESYRNRSLKVIALTDLENINE